LLRTAECGPPSRPAPIANAIFTNHCVFKKIGPEHPDDREFVDSSKQWYLSNKGRLKVNPYYRPDSGFSESQNFFVGAGT
jgi:hypothetical protein